MIRVRWSTATALIAVIVASELAAQRADTTIIQADAPLHLGMGTLVEELTIGAGSTAAEYEFTMIQIWNAPAGGVFVLDVANPMPNPPFRSSVRQYDRSGRFVRAFGREGQGPGEYSGVPNSVQSLPDGRVIILDTRHLLLYSALGQPLERWEVPPGTRRVHIDPAGNLHIAGERAVRREPVSRRGGAPPSAISSASSRGNIRPQPYIRPVSFFYRLGPGGRVTDTLVAPQESFPNPVMVATTPLPFAPKHVATWSPLGYFVTANGANFAVDLRLPRRPSDSVVSIRRTVAPVPVVDAERADWHQSVLMFQRSGGRAEWQWDGPEIPRTKPPIRDLMVSAEGRIWARVSQPARLYQSAAIRTRPATRNEWQEIDAARRWVEPWVFDVFEPAGRYVGRVRFPEDTGPEHFAHPGYAIRGDTVWGVVHDQDGLPSVKRYRIQWGG